MKVKLPCRVLCIKDYVNGMLRIRKGSYWKLIEYEEHSKYANGHPRYMVQHEQFGGVFFNLSDREYAKKTDCICFEDYFKLCN